MRMKQSNIVRLILLKGAVLFSEKILVNCKFVPILDFKGGSDCIFFLKIKGTLYTVFIN
jgi:hypothetical protein